MEGACLRERTLRVSYPTPVDLVEMGNVFRIEHQTCVHWPATPILSFWPPFP
jgi:hypothetical protein